MIGKPEVVLVYCLPCEGERRKNVLKTRTVDCCTLLTQLLCAGNIVLLHR